MTNTVYFHIRGKSASQTVEWNEYEDVFHVHLGVYTVMMELAILASYDNNLWAFGEGLIKKLGLSGDIRLLSHCIR